ncbi:MAG: DUF4350 domain-containing protein [Acidobacteria bacterium]|nr:DUF4350 domain-containing protein [Acidobacteriota bacterium]
MLKRRLPLPLPMLIAAAAVGIFFVVMAAYLVLPDQSGDPGFDASVANPTYKGGGPRVLFDEAHYNVHKSGGRYKPFADLIRNDGYEIVPNSTAFSAGSLGGYDVLVIANALGFRGAAQQLANIFRLEGKLNIAASAFTPEEISAVRNWVSEGGSLLLVADHAPAGTAAGALSAAFGIEMTDWYTEDPKHHDPETRNPAWILFSRENGLLGDHPITEGITSVLTFTGQSLRPPPNAVSFLKLSPEAVEFPRRRARPADARSAANLAQGVALEFGKGRVVALGEAAMLTSQVTSAGQRPLYFGMSRAGHQNRELALNIMRWLTENRSSRHQRSAPEP